MTGGYVHMWETRVRLAALLAPLLSTFILCLKLPVSAQMHPPEIRMVYPLGGSAGLTTRVTISGVSFRNAGAIIFDQPGISAKIVAPDFSKLPAPTLDNDNAPVVVVDFTVDRAAPRDIYSFRVISDAGVSSPGRWMVGRELPQIEEKEPNNGRSQAQSVFLPVSVNGHIAEASDTDTFSVDLDAGRSFVAEVVAAQAGSPLDSLLTLQDSSGTEVATNDDFGGPDSMLAYTPKQSGRYFLTLSSSVGEGGAEHAYRLSLGYLPLVTGTLPGTIPRGKTTELTTFGLNLPATFPVKVPADWPHGLAHVHSADGVTSNGIIVGVSDLPLVMSDGANTELAHALTVAAPGAVNGRFYKAGAVDAASYFYRFHADPGRRILIDLQCQDRSGTRCDPLLTLNDSSGALIEESDDSTGRDSHIDHTFDKGGDFVLRVKNLAGTNSPDLVYQLLIRNPPDPGFSLSTDLRARGVGQGGSAVLDVEVSRDRWKGPVTIGAADLPSGVTANTVVVADGVAHGLLVFNAAPGAPLGGFPLHITGSGVVGGKMITQNMTRAVDRIWNGGEMSLRPAPVDTLFYAVTPPYEVAVRADSTIVALPAGGSLKIHAKFERRAGFDKPFTLNVLGLPDGVTAAATPIPNGAMEADIEIKALANAKPGAYTILLDAITSNSPQVMLDRVSQPIVLTLQPPKPVAVNPGGDDRRRGT